MVIQLFEKLLWSTSLANELWDLRPYGPLVAQVADIMT
jgi:hypothetical protein